MEKILIKYPCLDKKLLLLAIDRYMEELSKLKAKLPHYNYPNDWEESQVFLLPLLAWNYKTGYNYEFNHIQFSCEEYPYDMAILDAPELIDYYCTDR